MLPKEYVYDAKSKYDIMGYFMSLYLYHKRRNPYRLLHDFFFYSIPRAVVFHILPAIEHQSI